MNYRTAFSELRTMAVCVHMNGGTLEECADQMFFIFPKIPMSFIIFSLVK